MKTAIEIAEKEIAELWGGPSDQPTYTKIFEVLERVKPVFEKQIKEAHIDGHNYYYKDSLDEDEYYNETFETNKETLK